MFTVSRIFVEKDLPKEGKSFEVSLQSSLYLLFIYTPVPPLLGSRSRIVLVSNP